MTQLGTLPVRRREGGRRRLLFGAGTILGLCGLAPAAHGQTPPPVRQLGQSDAESAGDIVSSIAALRALSTGEVFVNDITRHRVVMLDPLLRVLRIVADTAAATKRIYGSAATGLFPFRGDSTLFLDGAALAVFVLDSHGNTARVMGPPRPSDFGQLVGGAVGNTGVDTRGRLVYRMAGASRSERTRLGMLGSASPPESAAVVRFDFATRRLDTAAIVRIYSPRIVAVTTRTDSSASIQLVPVLNPAPTVDDWAILADGTIAIVRGQDYHVDFVDVDNRKTSGGRIPFAWRRLADSDKVALLDSSKSLRARLITQGISMGVGVAPAPSIDPSTTQGSPVTTAATGVDPNKTTSDVRYVGSEELPDYQPVFAAGAVRADADSNLWVRTIPPEPLSGGAIYDVIDRRGELIDRVQVPRGSTIAGFSPGGVILLG
ncbi:MAG: hypothetical protein ABJF01_26335, partial [bacterium]